MRAGTTRRQTAARSKRSARPSRTAERFSISSRLRRRRRSFGNAGSIDQEVRETSMAREVIDVTRRQVLIGLGGTMLALPVLPSLLSRAHAADPVFTRQPRLFWLTTDHGGAFESSMFPSSSLLTKTTNLFSDHPI